MWFSYTFVSLPSWIYAYITNTKPALLALLSKVLLSCWQIVWFCSEKRFFPAGIFCIDYSYSNMSNTTSLASSIILLLFHEWVHIDHFPGCTVVLTASCRKYCSSCNLIDYFWMRFSFFRSYLEIMWRASFKQWSFSSQDLDRNPPVLRFVSSFWTHDLQNVNIVNTHTFE